MNAGAKDKGSVHRLLDIVVEEVSLVDHAANKHRFLIVKRSNEMDETNNDTGAAEAQEEQAAGAPGAPEATDQQQPGGAEPAGTETNDALDVALGALEGLTGVVERLGTAEEDEARDALSGLAADLQSAADQLAALAGTPKSEGDSPTEQVGGEGSQDLSEVVAAVRATLQQVGTLMDGAARPGAVQDTEQPADSGSPPAPAEGAGGLQQELVALTTELRTLTGTVREQQQRLARLEKRAGLPNSAPSGERPPRRHPDDDDVGWPMDLNRPCDRESVDKSVSFHDV